MLVVIGTTNGGGSTPTWWDKNAIFAELKTDQIYDVEVPLSIGYKFMTFKGSYKKELKCVLVSCKTFSLNICDKTKTGLFQFADGALG